MSSIFKNIKGLFIEDDGSDQKKESTSKDERKESSTDMADTPVEEYIPSNVSSNTEAEVSHKYLELLFKALEDNNQDGFDYFEYKKALQYLKKMEMDEQTRFQSAFASARTMGTTPSVLLSSADYYLGVLAKENKQFEDAWKNQSKRKIDGKRQQKAELQKAVQEKTKMIEQLNAEIETSNKKLETIDQELSEAAAKVNKTKIDFEASYEYLVTQIKGDVEKMKLYLK